MENEIILLRNAIEHTILKPDTTLSDIKRICSEALENNFAAVCIPAYFLNDVTDILGQADIEIVTVAGFPFGYNSIMSKFEETEDALMRGADHVDVVVNIAAVKNNDWELVEDEIETVTKLIHSENKIIKIIIETGLLNEVELELMCKIANEHTVDYVKTSTGVSAPGANAEIVRSLRELLHPSVKIKASGGIKTREFALELLNAGADRIGTSAGVLILQQ